MNIPHLLKPTPTPSQRGLTYQMGIDAGIVDRPSSTGITVNETTAIGVSAVWCAISVISQSIGSLPLTMYRRGESPEVAADHPLADILGEVPNPETTAPTFWETFVSHALLWGNAYAEIARDGAGRPAQIWPIHPRNVQVDRTPKGELVYRVRTPANGLSPVLSADLAPEDVLHVPGLSPDGIVGWKLLQIARDSIGFSLAADRFGQRFFANNTGLGMVVSFPTTMSEDAEQNLRRGLQAYSGVDQTGRTLVLEEGATFDRMTSDNTAAQYDETRRYQIAEVSRLFNISPVKLHELGRATWGNLGTLNTDFWDSTCRPWAVKIEAEIRRKLLRKDERKTYFAEFDASTLKRGDDTTRYGAYKVGIEAGFLTPELVAKWENLPKPPKPEPVVVQAPPVSEVSADVPA